MATKETALTTSTAVKPLAISTRPEPPSSPWLVKRLTALATARQASVSRDTLILYTSELAEYREDDISQAIRKIAFTPREEGETAFPELGTIARTVRSFAIERNRVEERRRRREEDERRAEDRRQHPENYMSFRDFMTAFNESRKRGDVA